VLQQVWLLLLPRLMRHQRLHQPQPQHQHQHQHQRQRHQRPLPAQPRATQTAPTAHTPAAAQTLAQS
jgi:hypothetical protein